VRERLPNDADAPLVRHLKLRQTERGRSRVEQGRARIDDVAGCERRTPSALGQDRTRPQGASRGTPVRSRTAYPRSGRGRPDLDAGHPLDRDRRDPTIGGRASTTRRASFRSSPDRNQPIPVLTGEVPCRDRRRLTSGQLLMTNSNRVASRSGNSLGRAPPRTFATCSAALL
jgi:hypothetical protein